jgi:hypothetical protein
MRKSSSSSDLIIVQFTPHVGAEYPLVVKRSPYTDAPLDCTHEVTRSMSQHLYGTLHWRLPVIVNTV